MPEPARAPFQLITAEAVTRIIDATGLPVPNPEGLRADLQAACIAYVGGAGPRAPRLPPALKRHASALRQILVGQEVWPIAADRDAVLEALAEIVMAVDCDPPYQKRGALRELIAETLAPIYHRHTGKKAGASRPGKGDNAGGPYVRFVLAVSEEFGLTVTAETVARYLRK